MNVEKLIELLKKADPKKEVMIEFDDSECVVTQSITVIKEIKFLNDYNKLDHNQVTISSM